MTLPPVYIILSTTGIGGAEKRFFGLWQSLQQIPRTRAVKIVCTPELYSRLHDNAEFASAFQQYTDHIISADIRSSGFGDYREKIRSFVRDQVAPGSVLHFIGDHPLVRMKGMRQIYSITQSSLANLNLKGRLGQYAGVFFSDHTDILDPGIAAHMRKVFFYRKKSLTQTSNSFCDTDVFQPVSSAEEQDWVVFLGRFEPMKQVLPFVEALPQVHDRLRKLPLRDLRYFVFGHGSQENDIRALLSGAAYRDLPVEIGYEQHPEKILNRSAVFVSLQHHNNYPSKSLLEAMAAGNIPLVTDVGQTRWIAKPEYSAYVPEHFTAAELTESLAGIFSRDAAQRREMGLEARNLVLKEHTISRMRDYYWDIYSQL